MKRSHLRKAGGALRLPALGKVCCVYCYAASCKIVAKRVRTCLIKRGMAPYTSGNAVPVGAGRDSHSASHVPGRNWIFHRLSSPWGAGLIVLCSICSKLTGHALDVECASAKTRGHFYMEDVPVLDTTQRCRDIWQPWFRGSVRMCYLRRRATASQWRRSPSTRWTRSAATCLPRSAGTKQPCMTTSIWATSLAWSCTLSTSRRRTPRAGCGL